MFGKIKPRIPFHDKISRSRGVFVRPFEFGSSVFQIRLSLVGFSVENHYFIRKNGKFGLNRRIRLRKRNGIVVGHLGKQSAVFFVFVIFRVVDVINETRSVPLFLGFDVSSSFPHGEFGPVIESSFDFDGFAVRICVNDFDYTLFHGKVRFYDQIHGYRVCVAVSHVPPEKSFSRSHPVVGINERIDVDFFTVMNFLFVNHASVVIVKLNRADAFIYPFSVKRGVRRERIRFAYPFAPVQNRAVIVEYHVWIPPVEHVAFALGHGKRGYRRSRNALYVASPSRIKRGDELPFRRNVHDFERIKARSSVVRYGDGMPSRLLKLQPVRTGYHTVVQADGLFVLVGINHFKNNVAENYIGIAFNVRLFGRGNDRNRFNGRLFGFFLRTRKRRKRKNRCKHGEDDYFMYGNFLHTRLPTPLRALYVI